MTYAEFLQLLKKGESETLDYKIECGAFASNAISPKAELAKDICAMANNGNVTSRIIIGVSDDRKHFHSVKNFNLTDEKLQSFVRSAIFPPPKVKLQNILFKNASQNLANKSFVVLTVGPQARKPFRLNQDFINYSEKVCLRKHEAWIRRGSTSDLATPEEIFDLCKGRNPRTVQEDFDNIKYDRSPTENGLESISKNALEILRLCPVIRPARFAGLFPV